jgi:hypothetical protein
MLMWIKAARIIRNKEVERVRSLRNWHKLAMETGESMLPHPGISDIHLPSYQMVFERHNWLHFGIDSLGRI